MATNTPHGHGHGPNVGQREAPNQNAGPNTDRFVVIHGATTCDEHGVYVTKDSAEVIEIGWILLDAKNCEEVSGLPPSALSLGLPVLTSPSSCIARAFW